MGPGLKLELSDCRAGMIELQWRPMGAGLKLELSDCRAGMIELQLSSG